MELSLLLLVVIFAGVIVALIKRIKVLSKTDDKIVVDRIWFIVTPKQILKKDYRELLSCFYGPFLEEDEAKSYIVKHALPDDSEIVDWSF